MVRLVSVGDCELPCHKFKYSGCEEEVGVLLCDSNKIAFCPICGEKVNSISIEIDPWMVGVSKEYM